MKKKLVLFFLIVFSLIFSVVLTSCMDDIVIPGLTDNSSDNDDKNDDKNDDDKDKEEDKVEDDGKDDVNTVTFRYSGETVYTVELNEGEKLVKKDVESALLDLGYEFNGYFKKSDLTEEFSFDSEITGDIRVYCRNSYVVTYYYGGEPILVQHVDKVKKFFTTDMIAEKDALTIAGSRLTGIYIDPDADIDPREVGDDTPLSEPFDFSQDVTSDLRLYCKIFYEVGYKYAGESQLVLKQYVDAYEGFSPKQLERKDELTYHGYHFAGYYEDNGLETEFDFTKIPTADCSVFCERDLTKAGENVTWSAVRDTVSGGITLSFSGSGDMYPYLELEDVPWRHHYLEINKVVIPDGITSIANFAFSDCSQLKEVDLPDTIVFIGDSSFYRSGIETINFPDSVRRIGSQAFNTCKGLVDLIFNPGLEHIGDGAFSSCENVVTVVLTDTIMSFGTRAFVDCKSITSAYYIGTEEQYNRIDVALSNFWIQELAHTYFISESKPQEAGPYWYYDDDGTIRQWYYTIWYLASSRETVPFLVDYVEAGVGITNDNVAFRDGIVYHGYEFYRWLLKETNTEYGMEVGTMLTRDIKLVGDRGNLCGDNVKWSYSNATLKIERIDKTVDDGAMWDFETTLDAPWNKHCTSITKIIIDGGETGITHIGRYAFVGIRNPHELYSNFSYIDIPISVKTIDEKAFSGCDHLLYIYYEGTADELYGDGTNPPKISGLLNLEFNGAGITPVVYANATDEIFSELGDGAYWANIEQDTMEGRVAWIYDADSKSIVVGGGDGNHNMLNYDSVENTPWFSFRSNIENVKINDNIKVIGHNSFNGITAVKNISVTNRIEKISGSAFSGTTYYTNMYDTGAVYLYTSAEVVETLRYAYLLKVNHEKFTESIFIIPEMTIAIAEDAFENCSHITKIIMTKDVRTNSIYSTAFAGLTELECIYYEGLAESVDVYENLPVGVPVYVYSANEPTDNSVTWWHWNDTETEPVLWEVAP